MRAMLLERARHVFAPARALLAALVCASCGSIPEGVLVCANDSECPSGWSCRLGESRCYRSAGGRADAGPDASIPDGGGTDGGRDDGGSADGGCTPAIETCDGDDQDCDGRIDETFDLEFDSQRCGSCTIACTTGEYCSAGTCRMGAPALSDLWVITAGDGATGIGGYATVADVAATETDECVAFSWQGDLSTPRGISPASGRFDAGFYCRQNAALVMEQTVEDDLANAVTRLGGGFLFGGARGSSAFFSYVDGAGVRGWIEPVTSELPGAEVTGMWTDELGGAYMGGVIGGTITLTSFRGGQTFGDPTSLRNGYVMRVPSEDGIPDSFLSVDDRESQAAGPQWVTRVASSGDTLVLCGFFYGQIDAQIDPVSSPRLDNEAFVAAYDLAAGSPLWTVPFGGAGDQVCSGIGVDAAGNVYASLVYNGPIEIGSTEVTPNASATESLIVALDRDGGYRWSEVLEAASGTEARYASMHVDRAGNVYAVGFATGSYLLPGESSQPGGLAAWQGFVVSLDSTGRVRWTQRVGVQDGVGGEARLDGVDVVERTNVRTIVVGGRLLGPLLTPAGTGLSPTRRAGLVLVLSEASP
jgi:hypothetical protein